MPHNVDSYRSPTDDARIELDPKNNGSIVRKAFLTEGLINLFALPLVTHPRTTLSYILESPTQITPATIFLARVTGILIAGALTPALWNCLPNTRAAIESRRTVYITLGLGEATFIPLLLMEAMKGGRRDAALSAKACWLSVASLTPLLMWRAYVLFVRPEMVGRYREVKRE